MPPPPPPVPSGEESVLSTNTSTFGSGSSDLSSRSPAVFSSAPKSYSAPPQRSVIKARPTTTAKTTAQRNRAGGAGKSSAQLMAERVSAQTTVTRVAADSSQSTSTADPIREEIQPSSSSTQSSAAAAGEASSSGQADNSAASTDQASGQKKLKRPRKFLRSAGGRIWEDKTLVEWAPDEFRVFAGDLGNDVTEDILRRYFAGYPSLTRVHVVRDKRTSKTRGYGFLSFKDSADYVRAMREMNGKYVGSRPIKLKKSQWKDRQLNVVRKKERERNAMGML